MKAVLALCCLAVAIATPLLREAEYQVAFQDFVKTYEKTYSVEEFFHRFSIFQDNLDYINGENAKNLTYWLGVNEFSDLTHHEFLTGYMGRMQRNTAWAAEELESNGVPSNDVDWRSKGAVTNVKNQGSCGSCWAFSATGAIESSNFLATQKLVSFSEQQLVDCCKGSACGGSNGCNGGEESAAIAWVAKNQAQAQCTGADYSYTGKDGSCKKTCSPAVKVGGVKRFSGEPALITGIDTKPSTVAVDASGRGWQSYKGGVFDTACGQQLNHAILAVGYTGQYYIVKNSWGTSWGASGYIFMVRGKNICGVAKEPSYAT